MRTSGLVLPQVEEDAVPGEVAHNLSLVEPLPGGTDLVGQVLLLALPGVSGGDEIVLLLHVATILLARRPVSFACSQKNEKEGKTLSLSFHFLYGGGGGKTYEVEPGEVVDAEVLEATEVSPVERLAGLQIKDPPTCSPQRERQPQNQVMMKRKGEKDCSQREKEKAAACTLAEDDGVVVLDLDNAVGLEGGGELGPGLGEGAGHGEGQDGEEEKSTLHCCCDKVVLPNDLSWFYGPRH